MKSAMQIAALLVLMTGAAQAQSMNKTDDAKQQSPGTAGAMQNAPANGVATDPQQVQAQEANASKSSPGTVGAALALVQTRRSLTSSLLADGVGGHSAAYGQGGSASPSVRTEWST